MQCACMSCYSFATKGQAVAWHGFQWCVRTREQENLSLYLSPIKKESIKSLSTHHKPDLEGSTVGFSFFLRSLSSFPAQRNPWLFSACSHPCSPELLWWPTRLLDLRSSRRVWYYTVHSTTTKTSGYSCTCQLTLSFYFPTFTDNQSTFWCVYDMSYSHNGEDHFHFKSAFSNPPLRDVTHGRNYILLKDIPVPTL